MLEYTGHRFQPRPGNDDVACPLLQQASRRDTEGGGFAASAIRDQHRRAAALPRHHLDHRRHRRALIVGAAVVLGYGVRGGRRALFRQRREYRQGLSLLHHRHPRRLANHA
ncbi:MAG: hypothetical protein P8Y64_10305 [Gammaproteobacteria bacterium]